MSGGRAIVVISHLYEPITTIVDRTGFEMMVWDFAAKDFHGKPRRETAGAIQPQGFHISDTKKPAITLAFCGV